MQPVIHFISFHCTYCQSMNNFDHMFPNLFWLLFTLILFFISEITLLAIIYYIIDNTCYTFHLGTYLLFNDIIHYLWILLNWYLSIICETDNEFYNYNLHIYFVSEHIIHLFELLITLPSEFNDFVNSNYNLKHYLLSQ